MPLSYQESIQDESKRNPSAFKDSEPGSAILRKILRHNWQNLSQNGYLPNG